MLVAQCILVPQEYILVPREYILVPQVSRGAATATTHVQPTAWLLASNQPASWLIANNQPAGWLLAYNQPAAAGQQGRGGG